MFYIITKKIQMSIIQFIILFIKKRQLFKDIFFYNISYYFK
jgi:hypothetical protein